MGVWRACVDCLPTKANLRTKRVNISGVCVTCKSGFENSWHTFLECPLAINCWRIIGVGNMIDERMRSAREVSDVFLPMLHDSNADQANLIVMVMWRLWKARNDIIWNNTYTSAAHIISKARDMLTEWQMTRPSRSQMIRDSTCTKWHKPPSSFWKLNVDGPLFAEEYKSGAGMILRDDQGSFVACRTLNVLGIFEVSEGEAMALSEALSWIKQLGLSKVIIEVDSKCVADAVNSIIIDDSIFGDYIRSCKAILQSNPSFSFVVHLIRRQANEVAHCLARASCSFPSPNVWVEPPSIVDGLLSDICNCST